MGQSASISTRIEIAASPETVRKVFMDWQRYPEWTKTFKFSNPTDGKQPKQPADLQPKDTMTVDLGGTVFSPTIVENTPAAFQWRGNLYGLLIGTHQFHFTPSKETPGGTLLIQKEDFTGLLAMLFKPGSSSATKTQGNFDGLNRDIKAEAEKAAKV